MLFQISIAFFQMNTKDILKNVSTVLQIMNINGVQNKIEPH